MATTIATTPDDRKRDWHTAIEDWRDAIDDYQRLISKEPVSEATVALA